MLKIISMAIVIIATIVGIINVACANSVARNQPPSMYQIPKPDLENATPPPFYPSFYIGIQGGWSILNYKNETFGLGAPLPPGFAVKVRDSGVAGRAFVGYEFSKYIAAETGYTYYRDPELKITGPAGTTVKAGFNEQTVDLVAKLMLPQKNGVIFYVKGGGAYVIRGAVATTVNGLPLLTGTTSKDTIRPIVGVGVGYKAGPNVVIDASYSRVIGTGTSVGKLPSIDFFALGISYRFLPVYNGNYPV